MLEIFLSYILNLNDKTDCKEFNYLYIKPTNHDKHKNAKFEHLYNNITLKSFYIIIIKI